MRPRASARPALLVFITLWCLYALTAGGQGYSVDGTFSYSLSQRLATAPHGALSAADRDVLKRWGPVVPVLGAPFTWLGLRLARLAPWRDSVPLAGHEVRLHDWPPIGAEPSESGTRAETTLSLDAPRGQVGAVRIVSFLSFATAVPDGTPVAEITFSQADRVVAQVPLRAGTDTAEWAYDAPGSEPPLHARAPLAGHWPANPGANLYVARKSLPAAAEIDKVAIRYTAPRGRLHVRALVLEGAEGWTEIGGPNGWTPADQEALFGRVGFSFLNAPLMALTMALLVPLAALLGYPASTGVLLALGTGTTTLAWPYAKLDFGETAAAALAVGATVLALAGATRCDGRRGAALLVAGGTLAALAAGAKYTAAWFVPLLCGWVVLLAWPRHGLRALTRGTLFALVPALAAAAILLLSGGGPTVWVDWRGALARGWLDFSLWQGLYGLLLSPGKSVLLYAPPLVLALAGVVPFVRRHGLAAAPFIAVTVLYLVVFGSKGVWHGGGWGPRYLVPAVPFAACLALPVVDRARRAGGWPRWATAALAVAGFGVQILAVAKHPNLYTIMFRDQVLPALPDYGAPLGGPPALAYWRHFGGPQAGRQLDRPPNGMRVEDPPRGLGYAFAETGSLVLRVAALPSAASDLTVYACDWDHRGRRQRITLQDAGGSRTFAQDYDFSGCEYLTWTLAAGGPATVTVEALGPDTPVLSALFVDPASGPVEERPRRDTSTGGHWTGRYGANGYALFAWRRGGEDVVGGPQRPAAGGGERVWVDTGEQDLGDTALLYAPAFSPLLAHAWLLGNDAVGFLFPADVALQQRALASPPWRYLAGLEIQPPHPEFGLGLDFWPLLLRSHVSSHGTFMALVWLVEGALAAGLCAGAWGLAAHFRSAPRCEAMRP